jgi:hypothetical protein
MAPDQQLHDQWMQFLTQLLLLLLLLILLPAALLLIPLMCADGLLGAPKVCCHANYSFSCVCMPDALSLAQQEPSTLQYLHLLHGLQSSRKHLLPPLQNAIYV